MNKKHQVHIVCICSSLVADRANGFVDFKLNGADIMLGQRGALEHNDNFRQLLPIAIFLFNGKIWAYRRAPSSEETRLHGLVSVSCGGHWDAADLTITDSIIDINESIKVALNRELDEEISLTSSIISHRIHDKALCADDTAVDRVHMAIINIYELDGDGLTPKEDALDSLGFIDPKELLEGDYKLEAWTKYICQLLIV